MFEKGAIVTISNQIGVVVSTGKELREQTGADLNDHAGVWFGTLNGGIPEIWTIPMDYLSQGPQPAFKH